MEPGRRTPDPRSGGGLIVMVRTDPKLAARALAHDLHAQLAVGGTATEQALDRFLTTPTIDLRRPPDLDELAAAMRRAEAIRDQTRAATAHRLATSFNTRLAIHPDTIRRAAQVLIGARHDLALHRRATERRARRRRWARRLALAVALAGTTAAAIAGGELPALGVAGGALAVGAAVVGAGGLRARYRPHTDLEPALLTVVELAERRWTQVAGPDADPLDLEAVVRRYEPQHPVVSHLVAENPAVRAADRLAIERRAAWVAAWRAAVGDDAPLVGKEVAGLLRSDETEIWLEGSDLTPGPPTLVVVDPFVDLTDQRARSLHRRLIDLPRDHRVVVVLEPGTSDRPKASSQPEGVS